MTNYFDTDYFDFDSQKKSSPKSKQKKNQQQPLLLLLLAAGAAYYYFMVFLPEEEKREAENKIQIDINKVKTAQTDEYNTLLITLQSYLEWVKGTEAQKYALNSKKNALNNAIQELQTKFPRKSSEELAEELKQKREQEAKDKDLHWWRKSHSWADRWIQKNVSTFINAWKKLQGDLETFNIAAPRTFHFPPTCWNKFNEEQKKLANKYGKLLEKPEQLKLSPTIIKWYQKAKVNPVRGMINEATKEPDNNALFYGAPRTGKTALMKKICIESNKYPLIEIKGSTLSPRKQDYEAGITPLEKFIYTLVQIERDLEDNFDFPRASNGEVRYILFVDEADLISKHSSIDQYTKLTFLKECMEGVDKSEQSQNLWVFATNHISKIDEAVYQVGRLSNALNFSWTLGTFFHYAKENGIYNQFPKHWKETATLSKEDLQWANRFSVRNFKPLFLPFWRAFLANSENKKELEEKEATESEEGQAGIQIGELFEFFWNLKDGGQLDDFIEKKGKFVSPRKGTVDEVLDIRLSELIETTEDGLSDLSNELELGRTGLKQLIENKVGDLIRLVGKLNE